MLYRGLFATCVGLIAFMALLDVALPVAAGRLVDLISQEATPRRVWQVMAITVGITTLYFTVRYTMYRVWIVFAANIMRHLVIDAFERVQRFSSE